MTDDTDDQPLRAAAFLAQALGLPDEPAALAPDLARIERDAAAGVYAAELASSVGDAAFLVYAYDLAARDDAGRTGRDRFAADLATLQEAAERGVPGPRLLAHAATEDAAFLLATTPATYRALAGDDPVARLEATPADLPPGDSLMARRTAAEELLRLLRAADAQATAWLAATATGVESAGDSPTLAFTPEETELALFLLDDRSINSLLQSLDLVLTTARAQATSAKGAG